MKGQFVKNWVIAWSGIRFSVFVFTIAQLLLLIPYNESVTSTMTCTMLSCGWMASLIEYKNKNGGKAYDYSLLGGKKAEVYGMYMFILSYVAAIMAITAIVYFPLSYFCPDMVSVTRLVWAPVITAFGPLFIFGLCVPLYYRFGLHVFNFFTVVAMILYYIIFGSSVVFSGDGASWFNWFTWQNPIVCGVDLSSIISFAPALLVAVLIFYFVSMLLSVKLYKSVEC